MIRRWMALSPPGRLIDVCLIALRRLETKIGGTKPGTPPHIFAETGEVLFWLYAVGDTDAANLLSPGFRWARHQYAHGNLITELGEYHLGATLGHLVLDQSRLDEPPVNVWTPREHIGTYAKARKPTKAERDDYDARLAGKPVVSTLWDELSEVAQNVLPRDLSPGEA